MIRTDRVFLALLGAAAALLAAVVSPNHARAQGGDKGEVVLYYSADEPIARQLIEAFEKKTGVKVKGVGDNEAVKATGLAQRIRAEKDAPRADVFWNSEILHTIALGREGLLAPHESEALSDWPEQYRDENRLWHGFALRARVFVYNTNEPPSVNINEEVRPIRHVRDFFHPTFSGLFVMARPEFGTTYDHIAGMSTLMGDGDLQLWCYQMRKQRLRLVDGNAAVVRAVAMGEARGGMTDTDDVWAAKREGWPVDMIYIRHDNYDISGRNVDEAHGALVIPNTVARVKGGPNPDNAALLIDFLLSAEAEEMLAQSDSRNIPVRPEVAAKFPELAVPEPAVIDYDDMADHAAEALSIFRKAFPQ